MTTTLADVQQQYGHHTASSRAQQHSWANGYQAALADLAVAAEEGGVEKMVQWIKDNTWAPTVREAFEDGSWAR